LVLKNRSGQAQFDAIVADIQRIKEFGLGPQLLQVPEYRAQALREQVKDGFREVCSSLRITIEIKGRAVVVGCDSLQTFCTRFLSSEETLLNSRLSHYFYDPAHLRAAIEQDTFIQMGNKLYKFTDILRECIATLAKSTPTDYVCAKEQFFTRFGIVRAHLDKKFSQNTSSCTTNLEP
jgi:hypothetical protein